jgi:OmpA-OmpF porin, OOP family
MHVLPRTLRHVSGCHDTHTLNTTINPSRLPAFGESSAMVQLKFALVTALTFVVTAALGQQDRPGFKDPPMFNRLPHYFLAEGGAFEEKQFDGFEFRVKKGGSTEQQRVEGHWTHYLYTFDGSGAAASPVQIMRNYQNAAAKLGGKVLFDNGEVSTILVSRSGIDTWLSVEPYGDTYTLVIVEKQAMQQDIVADAAALKGGLSQDGHIVVPGIYFDFGKSEVKPESAAALKEITKMLQASPTIKVWVVGHTDNIGSAESNLALSNARAAAVIRSLTTQMGIDSKRLAPYGDGPYAPVASNKTDDGRARNRRVELVEQP